MGIDITQVVQNGQPPTSFTVSGTLSASCETPQVSGSCTTAPFVDPTVNRTTGHWTALLPNDKGCTCGTTVTFNAICKNDGSASAPYSVTIACCPAITPQGTADDGCDSSGNRIIQFLGTVTAPPGPPALCYWDYGDGTNSLSNYPPISINPGTTQIDASFTGSKHPYANMYTALGNTTTAKLKVLVPSGCADGVWTVGVFPPCANPCDPIVVRVSAQVQGCAPTSASVQLTANVTGAATVPTLYTFTVHRDGDPAWQAINDSPSPTVASGSTGWTGSGATAGLLDLSHPDHYTVSVKISPQGCTGDSGAFDVPACDNCPSGSDITTHLSAGSGTCADGMGRSVTLDFAALPTTNAGAITSYTWDFGDPASGSANTLITGPTASHTYQVPGTYLVTATAAVPAGCPPVRFDTDVTVPACSTTTTPAPTTTTTPVPTTPSPVGGSCLCILLLIAALAFIALAAIAFLAWGCGAFANLALLTFGAVAAVIGIVLLIIWILACRFCAALLFLISIFAVLVAAMSLVSILLFLLGLPSCAIGAIIDGGFFVSVLAVLYVFGVIIGCIARRN
jgi:hypothetical protein